MASNSFGSIFRFTTWGETHGKAIGVVVDGCPAGISIDETTINKELARRAPGKTPYTTPRGEKDEAIILSGVFEGKTTGAPISLLINNKDADSSKYTAIANLYRPGHANFTYLEKYGAFDYRGGGRASARETAGRVAAGAVARALLSHHGITVSAWLSCVGSSYAPQVDFDAASHFVKTSPIFAPCKEAEKSFIKEVESAKDDHDSVGGMVTFVAQGLPAGLGDPVYKKLSALLAFAMMSIPAAKGFSIGDGFEAPHLRGSVSNDRFTATNGTPHPASNHAGGTLGGISTGLPLFGTVAFKPTSSIFQEQDTVDHQGNPAIFLLPEGSRHDPCVAIRGVPVVEAMCLSVIADAWLANKVSKDTTCL